MRWAKFVMITVSLLMLLYVLGWSAIYAFLYEHVDSSWLKNVILVTLYITLFVVAIRVIAKSRQVKMTYLLFAQYVLCLAAVSVLQDIVRGWQVWLRGDTVIFLGINGQARDPEILYDDVGLLYAVRLPIPEWNWNVLLGISVLLLVLALGWFVKTIRRSRAIV